MGLDVELSVAVVPVDVVESPSVNLSLLCQNQPVVPQPEEAHARKKTFSAFQFRSRKLCKKLLYLAYRLSTS
jgi:hypothetical protein